MDYTKASPEIVKPVFEEGSTLPYLGVNYPFRIVNGREESNRNENVKLVNGEFLMFSQSPRMVSRASQIYLQTQNKCVLYGIGYQATSSYYQKSEK
jgi:hypothetical protein